MITLLPCYSLEDFSIYRTAKDANEIFSAWSALYHPALIDKVGKIPSWDRATNPTPGKDHRLVVIPPCCESRVPHDWLRETEEGGAVIIRQKETREEIVAAALDALGVTDHPFPEDDVETFYSLGFSHFVSELFSRKLRYMSNLDSQKFGENLLKAVECLKAGEAKGYVDHIRRAFELLAEAKEYFFPTAMKILDLTWLDRKSLTGPLAETLNRRKRRGESTNLVLPTFYLDLLRKESPETFDLLKEEIRIGRVTLLGGDREESPLYLLPVMEIANQLIEGLIDYYEAFDVRPTAFGRNGAGYSPVLPQLLRLTGYENALLFTRDGWRPNQKNQSRTHWRGDHQVSVETLSRNPLDGGDAKNFMELPDRIGYSSSSDSVLSVVFDYLPGEETPWLGDIHRMGRFAPVLGESPNLADFFKETKKTGVSQKFEKDDFRTNFLTRAARDRRPDPVSTWRAFYSLRGRMDALSSLALVAGLLSSDRRMEALSGFKTLSDEADLLESLKRNLSDLLFFPISLALDGLEGDERDTERRKMESNWDGTLRARDENRERVDRRWGELSESFARLLYNELVRLERGREGRSESNDGTKTETIPPEETESGLFLVNPAFVTKTVTLTDPVGETPETASMITRRHYPGFPEEIKVTLPPMTAVWIPRSNPESRDGSSVIQEAPLPKKKSGLLGRLVEVIRGEPASDDPSKMIEKRKESFAGGETETFYLIRNRHFEMKIDAVTGETRAVRTFHSPSINSRRGLLRQPGMGNRLAWQVALKLSDAQRKEDHRPEESSNFGYSMMRGESIEILENGPTVARLKIDGSLVTPDGIDVATFEEILTIPREGRIIDVDLTLQPKSLPTDGPWDNYYGLRFAWNDMMAEVRPACHGKSWETDRDYLQAPEWVEIKSEENLGVTILSGGIPFFRRYGQRRMDAILIPDGESGRRFHFGIGIDLADPLKEATRFLSPEPFILSEVPPLSKSVYRFLDVTGASISIIHLEPVYEEDPIPTTPNEGTVGGTTGDVERGSDREGVDNGGTDDDGSLPPLAGFRVVLQETSGKRGKAEIKSYWSIESVAETDLLSQKKGRALDLTDPHSLSVTLDASQILPLEFRLSKDVGE